MSKDGKPNKASPNMPPVNGESTSPVEDIVKKYESSIDMLSQREYRLQNRIGAIQERLEIHQNILNDPNSAVQTRISAARDIGALEDLQHKLENQFDLAESHRLRGQTTSMQRQLRTQTTESRSRERIASMTNRPDIFREGMKQIDIPTQQLYKSIERKKSQVNQLGSKIEDIFTGLEGEAIGDDQLHKVRGLGSQIAQLEREQAMEQSAIRQQRMGGFDPQGRLRRAEETLSRSGGFLEKHRIIKSAQRGEFGSLEEETQKLTKMFETLSNAQTNYQKSLEGSTEDQRRYSESLEQAREDVERQQKVTEAVRQYGSDGGGTIASRAQAFLGITMPASQAATEVATTHNIQQMQQRAAYAGMGLAQYHRADSAIQGNMAALTEEMEGQAYIQAFSDTMATRRTIGKGAEKAGSLVDRGIRIAAQRANLKQLWSAGDAGLTAANEIGQGTADLITQSSLFAKNYYRGEAGIPAEQAVRAFIKNITGVRADTRQAVWDVNMSTYQGLQGSGAMTATQMQNLVDPSNLAKLSALGLGQRERATLMPQMIQAIGASENYQQFMERAAQTRRARILSTDQFAQLTGQLANVGGGTENLMDIMKSAVAAGMDNSKNVAQMVGAVTQLSTQSAKMGVDVTGASGSLVAAGIQSLRANGVGLNVAADTTLSSIANWNKFATSSQVSLGNVMERAELRKMFPNAGVYQMNRLAKMSTEELHMFEIAATSTNAAVQETARKAAHTWGIDDILYRNGRLDAGQLKKIRRAQTTGILYNMALPESITRDDLDEASALIDAGQGDKISSNLRAALSVQNIRADALGLSKIEQKDIKHAVNGNAGAARSIEESQAKREFDKFNSGIKELSDAGGFKALAVAVEGLRELALPDKMDKVIQGAAEKFQVPKGFTDGADKIEKAGGVFERAANTMRDILKEMGAKDWADKPNNAINRTAPESARTKAMGRAAGSHGAF